MKKYFLLLLIVISVILSAASEYYDKPFILPGSADRYYKRNLENKMLDIDYFNFQACAAKLFIDSDEVYTRALEMFESAEESIYFSMYLFGGTIGEKILDILEQKIDDGVDVRLILSKPKFQFSSSETPHPNDYNRFKSLSKDDFDNLYDFYGFYDDEFELVNPHKRRNSAKPPYKEKVNAATDKNLPVVFANTRFLKGLRPIQVDHNKIILIDGIQAMIGGMNFADTVASNHDSMVEVIGPFVREIEKIFINNWILGHALNYSDMVYYNDIKAEKLMRDKIQNKGYIQADAYATVTAPYGYNTLAPLLNMIRRAEHTVYIAQLLFNEEKIIEEVAKAAKRGVDVKILVDPAAHLYSFDWKGGPNNKILGTFQQLSKKFNNFNGEVRHYAIDPGQELHSKMIVVDSKYVGTGSTNFASNAFDANYESFFFFNSPQLASAYESMFLWDWQNKSIVPDEVGLVEKLTGFIASLIF
ncbi:MAG: phospholipase D-like domain-containing protein [Candidatus Muiribacteriota bacterium]